MLCGIVIVLAPEDIVLWAMAGCLALILEVEENTSDLVSLQFLVIISGTIEPDGFLVLGHFEETKSVLLYR